MGTLDTLIATVFLCCSTPSWMAAPIPESQAPFRRPDCMSLALDAVGALLPRARALALKHIGGQALMIP